MRGELKETVANDTVAERERSRSSVAGRRDVGGAAFRRHPGVHGTCRSEQETTKISHPCTLTYVFNTC